jgi:CRISPR-associated endoribonuclease Cas6
MLVSTVLTLRPTRDAVVPVNLGRAAYALFLGMVRHAEPDLSARLHEPDQVKRFTVSSLQGLGRVEGGEALLSSAREYWLRFTSSDATLSQLLTSQIVPGLHSQISLDGLSYGVTAVTTDSELHPWAGVTSCDELIQRNLLGSDSPPTKITLHFLSPTSFRSGGKNVPLPTPDLVFGSLLNSWNAVSNVSLPPEGRDFASESMAISHFDLLSRAVSFGRFHSIGCIGTCTYVILDRDEYWVRGMNLLADFALYAGVGSKTTVGMGQTRRRRLGKPDGRLC